MELSMTSATYFLKTNRFKDSHQVFLLETGFVGSEVVLSFRTLTLYLRLLPHRRVYNFQTLLQGVDVVWYLLGFIARTIMEQVNRKSQLLLKQNADRCSVTSFADS